MPIATLVFGINPRHFRAVVCIDLVLVLPSRQPGPVAVLIPDRVEAGRD